MHHANWNPYTPRHSKQTPTKKILRAQAPWASEVCVMNLANLNPWTSRHSEQAPTSANHFCHALPLWGSAGCVLNTTKLTPWTTACHVQMAGHALRHEGLLATLQVPSCHSRVPAHGRTAVQCVCVCARVRVGNRDFQFKYSLRPHALWQPASGCPKADIRLHDWSLDSSTPGLQFDGRCQGSRCQGSDACHDCTTRFKV